MTFVKGEIAKGAKIFQKGKSGNPNGRPRQLFGSIMKELKDEGFEPIKREQIVDAFSILLGLTQEKLAEMVADAQQPMLLRIAAKRMLAKDGFEIVEKMLDRAHGKATQVVDAVVKQEVISVGYGKEE